MSQMDLFGITKKIVNLQESVVDHAFYVSTAMQNQTKSMMTRAMSGFPMKTAEDMDMIKNLMVLSNEATAGFQKAVNEGFHHVKTMLG